MQYPHCPVQLHGIVHVVIKSYVYLRMPASAFISVSASGYAYTYANAHVHVLL